MRYEDLLDEPEATIQGLFAFLEADLESPSVQSWLSNLKRNNHSKWRKQMAPADIDLFEQVAGESLRQFGYATTTTISNKIGTARRLGYRIQDRMRHWRHLAYMNTIEAAQIRLFGKQPFAE